ncbi:LPS O-antigen length regulator Wzz(fepE) [Providencia heimbachae]|uniref:O-antigen lipopolysaccharide chain length regulator n=1 Tax=Providencia heimbachae ATCC 35613 TaxID=1354272 RepID=A0A1B7JMM6_9GAMM|nr:LPS O-antigen length regulator Wzz(fepE) [Providencia heimbachae]OAT49183.1 O-antigen lipopolysaccharide chain length regulator [Providencia heimbachae ATCC 35613]SQH12381.1 Ferric enterobactin transport protein fepE [Providencia heimbachae]
MSNDQESQRGLKKTLMQSPQFNIQPSDEIDLMALFAVLLRNKWLIISFTVVMTVISIGVVSYLPQKWISTAIVIPPSSEEIQEVNALSAQLSVLEVSLDLSAQRIFSSFIDQYRSKVNQESYVRSTEYYNKLSERVDSEDNTLAKQRLVNQIISDSIQLKDQSKEKNSTSNDIILSFSASKPTEAQDLLEGYVRYAASKVRQQIKVEVENAIAQQLVFATESYKQEVSKIRTEYDVKVERLKRAVDIAKAAGIEKPIASDSVSINDDPDYPIALGTEALEKKLLIESQNRDLALMSESLQNRKNYINNLNELTSKELDFTPVKFILAPDLPLRKESPKSSLIVALSGILALIISCAFVLSRELYRDYRKENSHIHE